MNCFKILLPGIFLLLISCKSESYYGAVGYNDNKFDGSKKEMARYLVQVQNESQFLRNASILAIENAKMRTTFLSATEVKGQMESLILDLGIFAVKSGVKLPGALDGDADRDYQFLVKQVGKDKFDQYYVNECQRKLKVLEDKVKGYSAEGKEEQGRTFSSKHLTEISESISQIATASEALAAETAKNGASSTN